MVIGIRKKLNLRFEGGHVPTLINWEWLLRRSSQSGPGTGRRCAKRDSSFATHCHPGLDDVKTPVSSISLWFYSPSSKLEVG
jgi:hypothetical protein